jgi:hypothetical protein
MPVPGSCLGGSDVKRPDCGVTSRAWMRENRRAIERDQIVAARDVADFDNFARPEVADSRKAESGTPKPVKAVLSFHYERCGNLSSKITPKGLRKWFTYRM